MTSRSSGGFENHAVSLAFERLDGAAACALGVAAVVQVAALSEPPEVEAAGVRYREALALAEKLGMRPLVAHCRLGLGRLYRITGQPAQAREHLATATAMYREMDLRYWLAKVDAAAG